MAAQQSSLQRHHVWHVVPWHLEVKVGQQSNQILLPRKFEQTSCEPVATPRTRRGAWTMSPGAMARGSQRIGSIASILEASSQGLKSLKDENAELRYISAIQGIQVE